MTLPSVATRIIDFLHAIGIPVTIERLPGPAFLPGIAIRDGTLACDPARLGWPGDLLHEAGHIAVTDPAGRATLSEVPDDPAEEMAAIAWSYAAALAIGLDPAVVLHDDGYGGDGEPGASHWLVAAFASGGGPGVPMLRYWGMTEPGSGTSSFPAMSRWLR